MRAEDEGRPLRMTVTGMPSLKELPHRISIATQHRDLVTIDGPPPARWPSPKPPSKPPTMC